MNVLRPRAVDQKDPRFFELRTARVKATKTASQEGDKYFIEGIASSTVMDSYGDILTESCQVSMLDQCKGMTSWLNHSYDVPEDIVGTIAEATLLRGTAGDGTGRDDEGEGPCVDLYIKVEIDPANPRAMKAWNHVNNGTKLAFSIGGWFTDVEMVENDSVFGWGFLVNDIELLEISLVGLPANPRAYTKALETVTDKMRAYVVERAEELLKEKNTPDTTMRDCTQMAVKAMFGSEPEPCAHIEGEARCTNPCANDSLLCDEHDAATRTADEPEEEVEEEQPQSDEPTQDVGDTAGEPSGGDAPAATAEPDSAPADASAGTADDHPAAPASEERSPDVISRREPMTDMKVQGCISAMKCIKSAVAHGMCQDSAGDVRSAHAIIKALLPDDYDIPDDAELGDESELSVTISADTSEFEDKIASLVTQSTDLQAQVTSISAERDALAQEVDKLKAIPIGRTTKSSLSGGTSHNEPTAAAALYYKAHTELAGTAARQSGRQGDDARSRLQV